MTRSTTAIAINLSYVLHERSDSLVVERYASQIQHDRRRRERRVSQLQTLPIDELRSSIKAEGYSPSPDQSELRILSVKIGAWRILEPLLLAAYPAIEKSSLSLTFADGDDDYRLPRVLFRGTADLCVPGGHSLDESDFFAAAIVRPGDASIQLRLESLAWHANDDLGGQQKWDQTGQLIEQTIREFVLQWDCDRPLWSNTAQEALPEFKCSAARRGDA